MKNHMDLSKVKIFCFINDCDRFYCSMETLKKHVQKIHLEEYNTMRHYFSQKNFNQIYKKIKHDFNTCLHQSSLESSNNHFHDNIFINKNEELKFINYKDFIYSSVEISNSKKIERKGRKKLRLDSTKSFRINEQNSLTIANYKEHDDIQANNQKNYPEYFKKATKPEKPEFNSEAIIKGEKELINQNNNIMNNKINFRANSNINTSGPNFSSTQKANIKNANLLVNDINNNTSFNNFKSNILTRPSVNQINISNHNNFQSPLGYENKLSNNHFFDFQKIFKENIVTSNLNNLNTLSSELEQEKCSFLRSINSLIVNPSLNNICSDKSDFMNSVKIRLANLLPEFSKKINEINFNLNSNNLIQEHNSSQGKKVSYDRPLNTSRANILLNINEEMQSKRCHNIGNNNNINNLENFDRFSNMENLNLNQLISDYLKAQNSNFIKLLLNNYIKNIIIDEIFTNISNSNNHQSLNQSKPGQSSFNIFNQRENLSNNFVNYIQNLVNEVLFNFQGTNANHDPLFMHSLDLLSTRDGSEKSKQNFSEFLNLVNKNQPIKRGNIHSGVSFYNDKNNDINNDDSHTNFKSYYKRYSQNIKEGPPEHKKFNAKNLSNSNNHSRACHPTGSIKYFNIIKVPKVKISFNNISSNNSNINNNKSKDNNHNNDNRDGDQNQNYKNYYRKHTPSNTLLKQKKKYNGIINNKEIVKSIESELKPEKAENLQYISHDIYQKSNQNSQQDILIAAQTRVAEEFFQSSEECFCEENKSSDNKDKKQSLLQQVEQSFQYEDYTMKNNNVNKNHNKNNIGNINSNNYLFDKDLMWHINENLIIEIFNKENHNIAMSQNQYNNNNYNNLHTNSYNYEQNLKPNDNFLSSDDIPEINNIFNLNDYFSNQENNCNINSPNFVNNNFSKESVNQKK